MEENRPIATTKTEKKTKRILTVSLAAASLLASATSALGSIVSRPVENAKTAVEVTAANTNKTLPGPLVLKPAGSGQLLAFDHQSHVSHGSHHSHHSHHSHTSHTSGL
jgi:hypothetical protein